MVSRVEPSSYLYSPRTVIARHEAISVFGMEECNLRK